MCVFVCARARGLSFSFICVSLRRLDGTISDARLLHLSPSLSFSPSRYAPTGTYRTTFLLLCSQWPATATLLPLAFPSAPRLSRSNRILDAFSSLLRVALLVSTWLRGTYYAYSCKLRSRDCREYGETIGGIISEHCLGEYPAVHAWIAWEENKARRVSANGNR